MPTTAIVIPAKYVYVSPTNTEEGYLEDKKKGKWGYTTINILGHHASRSANIKITSCKRVKPKKLRAKVEQDK